MTVYSLEELSRLADAFSEDLNNKVDLPDNKSQSDIRQIVEVSSDSILPSWYRVYSDGWVEQGGDCGTSGAGLTTTYLKAFADTNYTMVTTILSTYTGSGQTLANTGITAKTATSFTCDSDANTHKIWFACGYGADS